MKIDYQKLDARVMELKDELIADIQAWVAVPSVQSAPLPGNALWRKQREDAGAGAGHRAPLRL